ncbi:MAG: filamentous hemagglutinin N-terminal domain-containing protein [Alphaproteobacteria bacterium]|jgi:filamentous hemagglutinin family protein|nr:filamentous hemagglutinin N-terminal domain-containing protein [Alphaproteobacteria bacterium]
MSGLRAESRRAASRLVGLAAGALVGGLALALSSTPAGAGPGGGRVVAGEAEIAREPGGVTRIDQATRRAVITWQDFSIGAGETTIINQPDAGSISLNRVVGSRRSALEGRLESNGRVWLVNPQGVLVGPDARIDVGGFLATTADIADRDFLEDRFVFDRPSSDPDARVVNQGRVSVGERGLAALVAPGVENSGVIEGRLAQVVIAGSETFAIDFHGDGLVRFAASGPVTGAPEGAEALVAHSGAVHAPGGRVLITAEAADGVIDRVINLDGVVEARTVSAQDGVITLDGGLRGEVALAGRLDAGSSAPDGRGGSVTVLGRHITLEDGAAINVVGAAGGGRVAVGGSRGGAGPLPNAARVDMAPGARIAADATGDGDGGAVVLWSDSGTRFAGTITARGGPAGGDGGFVETSAAAGLLAFGTVSAGAPAGAPGRWLIDPASVRIDDLDPEQFPVAPPIGFDDAPDIATISTAAINNAGQDVIIQATTDITVAAPIDIAEPGVGLTFQAGRNITIDAPVTTNNGPLHLEAHSPHAPAGFDDGAINFFADVATGTGTITLISGGINALASVSIRNRAPGQIVDGPSRPGNDLEIILPLDRIFDVDAYALGRATTAGPDGSGESGTITLLEDSIAIGAPLSFETLAFQAAETVTQGEGAALAASRLVLEAGGNVSLPEGNAVAELAADIGGSLSFRTVGDLSPAAAGEFAGILAGEDLSLAVGGSLLQGPDSVIAAGNDLSLTIGGDFAQQAGAVLTAGNRLTLDIGADAVQDPAGAIAGRTFALAFSGPDAAGLFFGANDVDVLELQDLSGSGASVGQLEFRDADDLGLGGTGAPWVLGTTTVIADGALVLQQPVTATSDIVLVTREAFDNAAGAGLTAEDGRFLVYSVDPRRDVRGGLPGGRQYGRDFAADPPPTIVPGIAFLYEVEPVLTVAGPTLSRFAGDPNPPLEPVTVTGFIDGDTAATALTGAPALSTPASPESPAGSFPILVEAGTLASPAGYGLSFVAGRLDIEPLPAERVLRASPDLPAVLAEPAGEMEDAEMVLADPGEPGARPNAPIRLDLAEQAPAETQPAVRRTGTGTYRYQDDPHDETWLLATPGDE